MRPIRSEDLLHVAGAAVFQLLWHAEECYPKGGDGCSILMTRGIVFILMELLEP